MIIVDAGRFRMGCVSGVGCLENEPVREVSFCERSELPAVLALTDAERAPKNWRDVRVNSIWLQGRTDAHPLMAWKDPGYPQGLVHKAQTAR